MKILFLALMLFSSISVGYKNNYNHNFPIHFAEISLQKSAKVDEFYDYWINEFRLIETCNVTYSQFKEMYEKYNQLSAEEKDEVNVKEAGGIDGAGYTVKNVIDTLVNKFNSSPNSSNDGKIQLDQSTMIGIISGVAIFGLTAILVLYILKNKKIIK